MKDANALAVRASRNGNNAATGVRPAYIPAHLRGHLATACGVQTKFESHTASLGASKLRTNPAHVRNISAGA